MTEKTDAARTLSPTDVLAPHDTAGASIPIWLVSDARPASASDALDAAARRWLEATRFSSAAKKQAIVPGEGGTIAGVAFGLGNGTAGEPSGPSELLIGQLAASLPQGQLAVA